MTKAVILTGGGESAGLMRPQVSWPLVHRSILEHLVITLSDWGCRHIIVSLSASADELSVRNLLIKTGLSETSFTLHKEKVHRGSDNVFADIGVAHPERVMARAQIMSRIAEIIKDRGLTQKAAAELLDIPQSKVSCLMNGKLSMFSLDYLFEILNALDRDVEIIIKPKTKYEKLATTHVLLAAF